MAESSDSYYQYDDSYDFNSCIKDELFESFYSRKKEEQNEEENSIKITEAENNKNIENSQNMEGFQKRSNNTIIKIENNKIIGDEKNNINSINSSFKNDILENEDFMEDIQKNEINFNKIKNINTIGLKSEIKKTENSTNILKKKRGRNCTRLTGGVHNKYSDDNLRRKCKHIVLFSIMEFINKKIYLIYKGNLGNNIYRKEILTMNKSQKSNSNISFNRVFANKKLSDILSDNISSRYSNYLPEHNKLLIERLKNDEDENKSIYFNKLFGLTFKDCLAHFIGKITLEELKGMKRFDNIKEIFGDDKEYINILGYYLENFENIIYNKNPRRPKKVKNVTLSNEEK